MEFILEMDQIVQKHGCEDMLLHVHMYCSVFHCLSIEWFIFVCSIVWLCVNLKISESAE